MDNLKSHKSSFIWKVMTHYPNTHILYTPAQTPQFSPIENMFGYTKGKMKGFMFNRKEELTMKVMSLMLAYNKPRIMSFYRKTLSNMMEFWTKLDKDGLFNWVLNFLKVRI